jgi:hypothetical protein
MIAEIDAEARLNSMKRGLPPCLHVPIAARDLTALCRFVGTPTLVSSYKGIESAFLVEAHDSPDERDATLPIWELERSAILHERLQLWVDVAYRGYRRAYRKAFPDRAVSGWHLDHVMNRQIAKLKGLKYIRIVAISPGANTSSGGLSERMGSIITAPPRWFSTIGNTLLLFSTRTWVTSSSC